MLSPPIHKGKNMIILKIPRSRQFNTIINRNKRIQSQPPSFSTVKPLSPAELPPSTKSYSTIYHNYQMKTINYNGRRNQDIQLRNSARISDNLSKRRNLTKAHYESLSNHRKRYDSNLPKIQEQMLHNSLKKSNIQLKLPKENQFKRERKKQTIKMATIQQIVERLQKKYSAQNCESQKLNQVIKIKIKPKPKQAKSFLSLDVNLDGLKRKTKKKLTFRSLIEKKQKKEYLVENYDINGWTKDNKSERFLNLSRQNFF